MQYFNINIAETTIKHDVLQFTCAIMEEDGKNRMFTFNISLPELFAYHFKDIFHTEKVQ